MQSISWISTYHKETKEHASKSKKKKISKPFIVLDYNINIGDVDVRVQILQSYPVERKRKAKCDFKFI